MTNREPATRESANIAEGREQFGHADLNPLRLKRDAAYQQAYDAGANACFGRVFDIADVLKEVEILLANPKAANLVDRQTLRLSQRTA